MKKLLRPGFTATALTLVFSLFAATEAKAQMTEVLKRMDENYKKLKTLRTNVTYERYDSVLKEPDVREGKAIYALQKGKDAFFRVDWIKPAESLSVVNKQYVIYRQRLQQCYAGSTSEAKNNSSKVNSPLAFINMSKKQLRDNYDMKYMGEETLSNGTKTWHLELAPKTAQEYKKADIWVDGNGMPVQMKVIEKNNDSTSVLLRNIEKNLTLNSRDFTINRELCKTYVK